MCLLPNNIDEETYPAMAASGSTRRRFEELDSLRGLAAVAVVFHHFLYLLPAICDEQRLPQFWLITYTPLHIFWAGREAVLFFFLLSGFVLSLPFLDHRVPLAPFLVKRVFRIYMPYLAAVFTAFAASTAFSRGGIPELSAWVNRAWMEPVTLRAAVQHFFLIGSFDNMQFDPVLWSLVHEMRISIMFPALMLLVMRKNWVTALSVGLVVSAIAHLISGHTTFMERTDYVDTFKFVYLFIVGAVLAQHRWRIVEYYSRLSRPVKYFLVIIATVFYTYKYSVLPDVGILHKYYFNDLMVTVGIVIFILTGLAATSASRLLTARPLVYTGKISYSIYLFHAILLFTWTNLLYGVVPLWAIMLLTFVTTFPLSALAYRYVEEPSISLGRRAASRLSASKTGNTKALPVHDVPQEGLTDQAA